MTLEPGIKYGRHSRWRLTDVAANQIWQTLRKHPTYLISNKIILTNDRQSTGKYTHIYQGENTNKSSSNLQVLIHGNSETVLTDVIQGKPKQIKPTTQSY